MWTVIALIGVVIGLAATLRQFQFVKDYPTRLLLLVLWGRLSIMALHEYTTGSLAMGLSISAIATIGFSGIMLLAARPRDFAAPHFAIYLPMLLILVISTAVNRAISGFIVEVAAWALFVATLQLTTMAIVAHGMGRAMRAIMAPFLTPILLQFASIAVGKSIGSELGGSQGFIGGYLHEVIFSQAMLIFGVAAMLAQWRSGAVRLGLLIYVVWAIFMANYRTSIIAVLPITGVVFATGFASVFRMRYRPVAIASAITFTVVAAILIIPLLPPRFSEIFEAMTRFDQFLKPASEYTQEDKSFFSTRFFLWSLYITSYSNGDLLQLLFGFGPFGGKGVFHTHAHNNFVQYLYEYGILGTSYFVTIILFNIIYCLNVVDKMHRIILLSLHVGFVMLNMATGPMKYIEGLLLYAIITAATIAAAQRSRVVRSVAPA